MVERPAKQLFYAVQPDSTNSNFVKWCLSQLPGVFQCLFFFSRIVCWTDYSLVLWSRSDCLRVIGPMTARRCSARAEPFAHKITVPWLVGHLMQACRAIWLPDYHRGWTNYSNSLLCIVPLKEWTRWYRTKYLLYVRRNIVVSRTHYEGQSKLQLKCSWKTNVEKYSVP